MSAVKSGTDGVTRVSLADLVAMRAYAAKPDLHATRARISRAGGHASKVRGRGMDYAESRIYQPGDDVRCIDWRRTARSGRWHTKLFQEERDQRLLALVDTHATMRFGTRVRFKSVAAARAVAWWTWTGVRAGDRIGAAAFGAVRDAFPPHVGTRGALGVLGAVARWDAQLREDPARAPQTEPLSLALQRLQRLLAPGCRVLLVSDGWCVDGEARAAMARIAARVDLRVAIIVDALEHTPAAPGVYTFESAGHRAHVDLGGVLARGRFRDQLAAGHQRLAQLCDATGVPWVLLASDTQPAAPLQQLWRRVRGRR